MAMDYQLGLDTSQSCWFVNTVSYFPWTRNENWSLQRQNPLGDGLGGFLFAWMVDPDSRDRARGRSTITITIAGDLRSQLNARARLT